MYNSCMVKAWKLIFGEVSHGGQPHQMWSQMLKLTGTAGSLLRHPQELLDDNCITGYVLKPSHDVTQPDLHDGQLGHPKRK